MCTHSLSNRYSYNLLVVLYGVEVLMFLLWLVFSLVLIKVVSLLVLVMGYWLSFRYCHQQAHAHYRFGPMSFCLSMNYLDRFLSVYELPVSSGSRAWFFRSLHLTFFFVFGSNLLIVILFWSYFWHKQKGKDWTVQLLTVACLSLAAKMEESEVPLLVELQV